MRRLHRYPFPCALHDALAGYLYLIRPPPEAKHRPVDPSRLIAMGDSAGGGLTLALLCLLRDMRIPLPSGGVIVSPWLDLTHSFPSILQNTATDIIPPYGFMHKPSVMWPPPSADEQAKIQGYTSITAIRERQADRQNSRKPSGFQSLRNLVISPKLGTHQYTQSTSPCRPSTSQQESRDRDPHEPDHPILSESHGAQHAFTEEPENMDDLQGYHDKDADSQGKKPGGQAGANAAKENQESTEPDEHIRLKVDGKDIALNEQIQFYALNSREHAYYLPTGP